MHENAFNETAYEVPTIEMDSALLYLKLNTQWTIGVSLICLRI